MDISSFEKKFIDKITQIVKVGPDLKPGTQLHKQAQEYVFGYVPVDEIMAEHIELLTIAQHIYHVLIRELLDGFTT